MGSFEDIALDGLVNIHKITTDGQTYAADDVREAYQGMNLHGGSTGDEFVEDLESNIANVVREALESAFPSATQVDANATLDRETLEAEPDDDPHHPPVGITVTGTVTRPLSALGLEELTEDAIDVVFSAGARVTSQTTLTARPGHTNTFTLTPPDGLAFDAGNDAAQVSDDGRSLSVIVDNAGGSTADGKDVAMVLYDPDARVPDTEDVSVGVGVDLADVDVTVAGAAGGDFGRLLVEVGVEARMSSLAVREDVREYLPDAVELEYLSADAIRAFARADILTDEHLTDFEERLLDVMRTGLGGALGAGDVTVDGGFEDASLNAEDPDAPLVFRAFTSLSRPLAPTGGGDPQAQAAVALYSVAQSFPLQRVQDFETTYRVTFPKGIAVMDATATGGTVDRGTSNGRDWFEATPGEEGSTVTVEMAVTPAFVIAKFWPVLLGVAAVILLLIGGPIALFARRRRKKKKA